VSTVRYPRLGHETSALSLWTLFAQMVVFGVLAGTWTASLSTSTPSTIITSSPLVGLELGAEEGGTPHETQLWRTRRTVSRERKKTQDGKRCRPALGDGSRGISP
jgi:hypothetical protein